jgi:subtilase family serine protease
MVKKMKIRALIILFIVATLSISAYCIPISLAQTTDVTLSSDDLSSWQTGSTYHYYVDPLVTSQAYSEGFLANTVTELRAAYNLNPLYASGYDGKGQTIVIVDAYGSPTIYQDLLLFIQWQNNYGANLPWTTLKEIKQHLNIYYPFGKPRFDATDQNQLLWSTEVTLDVDMAHAIAPKADIALVIAPSDDDKPLDLAVNYAINNHLGSIISLSWGTPEFMLSTPAARNQALCADLMYQRAAQEDITVFAGTGDWGASNGATFNNAFFPASDPYVTAVGGTNLFMTCSDGFKEGTHSWDGQNHFGIQYFYEIAGNDYQAMAADGFQTSFDAVTTGGAQSALFPLPYWQRGITLTNADGTSTTPTGRCIADVSFNSGVYGGLGAIFLSAASPKAPKMTVVGGTSAGSPFWAALTAIANQYTKHSLGYLNPQLYLNRNSLYKLGAFHDITLGDNTYPSDNSLPGYKATHSWDAPTGIGSPNSANLVPIIAKIVNADHYSNQWHCDG